MEFNIKTGDGGVTKIHRTISFAFSLEGGDAGHGVTRLHDLLFYSTSVEKIAAASTNGVIVQAQDSGEGAAAKKSAVKKIAGQRGLFPSQNKGGGP